MDDHAVVLVTLIFSRLSDESLTGTDPCAFGTAAIGDGVPIVDEGAIVDGSAVVAVPRKGAETAVVGGFKLRNDGPG
jgi:hypothetical protein